MIRHLDKNIKNLVNFFAIIFCVVFVFSSGIVLAQIFTVQTLEDFGISKEAEKYFSADEIKDIFGYNDFEKIIAKVKARVEEFGTPEEKANIDKLFIKPKIVAKTSSLPKDVVNCFDYYHFMSVQTDILSIKPVAIAGTKMEFFGSITNQNSYPIVNGTLYVKIFRERSSINDSNGPDIVDQFIVKDNITIPAEKSVPVSFTWQVPSSLTTGNYRIASFFIVDKKFNLLGLSFTDDIIGNIFNFQVTGEKTNVQFDKAGVILNNNPFYFVAFSPKIENKDPAVISTTINNTTNTDQTVKVIWNIYKWDAINPDNFIRAVFADYTIKAGSSIRADVTVTESEASVYYVVGELAYKDSKSIVGIRFIRPGVDKARLNFPSIRQFPIRKGVISTMFSCLHNSGSYQIIPDGKLIMKILDSVGKTIDEYTYQGPVTGEMMAVKKDFTAKNNIDHFFLLTELWQDDKLVDQNKTEYDCNKIDATLCNPRSDWSKYILFGIVTLGIILVGGSIAIFLKRRKY